MRTILIVFAILLVLLTLLGTFGGSIKYREPFYETSVYAEQEQRAGFEDMPPSDVVQQADMPPPTEVDMSNVQMSDMPPPPPDSAYGANNLNEIANSLPVEQTPVEGFYEPPSQIPIPPGLKSKYVNLPQAPQLAMNLPQPPAQFDQGMEGFMIEPFEQDTTSSYPAAY